MVSSDSIASSERHRRISHFKDRISALRATSKVYELRCDKSINTLDSSTIASFSTASHASCGSRSVRIDAVRSPVSPTVISTSSKGEKKNPFNDDTDSSYSSDESSIKRDMKGNGNSVAHATNSVASDQHSSASAISLLSNGLAKGDGGRLNFSQLEERDDEARVSPKSPPARVSPGKAGRKANNPFHDSDDDSSHVEVKATSNNPFGVTPNPFDDSSIDDDDDESFIGVLRAAGRPTAQQQSRAKKHCDKSVSSSDDSNTITSDSIDGDLFSGFQQLMVGKSECGQGNEKLKKPKVADSDDSSRGSTILDNKRVQQNPFRDSEDEDSTIDADADVKQSDHGARKNPFADSDEKRSHNTTIDADDEPTAANYAPSPNPFDADPVDDNDDESSCVQHLVARQTAKEQHSGHVSVSSSIKSSVVGALTGKELMTDKKTTKMTKQESGDETRTESQETTPAANTAKQVKHRRKGSSVSHVSWSEKKSVASYSSSSFGGFSIESVEDFCDVVEPKQQIAIPELQEPAEAPEPVLVLSNKKASASIESKKEPSPEKSIPVLESASVPSQQAQGLNVAGCGGKKNSHEEKTMTVPQSAGVQDNAGNKEEVKVTHRKTKKEKKETTKQKTNLKGREVTEEAAVGAEKNKHHKEMIQAEPKDGKSNTNDVKKAEFVRIQSNDYEAFMAFLRSEEKEETENHADACRKTDVKPQGECAEGGANAAELKSVQVTEMKKVVSSQSKSSKNTEDVVGTREDSLEVKTKQHMEKESKSLYVPRKASKETKGGIESSIDAPKATSNHDTMKKAAPSESPKPLTVAAEISKDKECAPSQPAPSPTSVLIGPGGDKKKPDTQVKQSQRVTPAAESVVPKKKWKMGADSWESSSMGSTIASVLYLPEASKISPKDDGNTVNPFADILAMRASEKKNNSVIVKRLMERGDISQVSLEASSQETESESASALEQEHKFVIENTDKIAHNAVDELSKTSKSVASDLASPSNATSDKSASSESCYSSEESSEESVSLGGNIFTDLRKVLSKIQSVSYEATDDEDAPEDEESAIANNQEDDEQTLDTKDHPKVVVRSAESCAVSSLKDTDFKAVQYMEHFEVYGDDDDDVASVPKSPLSIELVEVQDNGGKNTGNHNGKSKRTLHNTSAPASDSVIVDKMNDREVNLTPPKHAVVLNDGSVSTKDSIVGKTIRVTNAEIVAERIYLESLRAQVHAELKVHVADEEIRLALEARLQAIRDFYKRKATVSQLRSGPGNSVNEFVDNEAGLTQHVSNSRPKILRDKSVAQSVQTAMSSVSYPRGVTMDAEANRSSKKSPTQPVEPPSGADLEATPHQKGATMNSSTRNTQESIYARAQANIDEALKAANLSLNEETDSFEGGKRSVAEKKDTESDAEEEDEFLNNITGQAKLPADLFTQDTFWIEEEAVIHSSPTVKSQSEISNPTVLDSWAFYKEINNLMSESRVYEYQFQTIQQDPLYPYLNSLIGIADSGDDGSSDDDKQVKQQTREEFKNKSPHRICHILSKEANEVLPELIGVCQDIGRKLGMHTMAIGPVKTASAALIKSEKKYAGNPLLVTDFCRVSLFVPDIATLLALIEIVLSKYSSIIKRIKLSSLKSKHLPLVGGYRDCKINVDIDGHICEIQVHLEPMWNIKEESGYSHYKSCFENNVNDPMYDISRTLIGLDREFLSDLIKAGEGSVKSIPVSSLKPESEDHIRAYSALASLYLYYGLPVRAEYTLRQIVKLRTESVSFGPGHAETVMYLKLLRKSLKMQHKYKSASAVTKRIARAQKTTNGEEDIVGQCAGDQCGAIDHICDSILDPSKKEREEEKERAQRVEDSRAIWLGVRKTYFK